VTGEEEKKVWKPRTCGKMIFRFLDNYEVFKRQAKRLGRVRDPFDACVPAEGMLKGGISPFRGVEELERSVKNVVEACGFSDEEKYDLDVDIHFIRKSLGSILEDCKQLGPHEKDELGKRLKKRVPLLEEDIEKLLKDLKRMFG